MIPYPNTKQVVIFCLLTAILCLADHSFAQDFHTLSGKKITWHNISDATEATGGLEIVSHLSGADVYINGKLAGSTPLRLENIVIGKYSILVKAAGYSDYRTKVEITQGQFLVVNAAISRALHIAWKQSRTKAIQSSLLIPGKGQVDLGFSRGWSYFYGCVAVGGYAYYQWGKNADAQDNFNKSSAAYSVADNPETADWEYQNMMTARDDMHTHQLRYEYSLIAIGSIWALNMLDVLFIAGREPVIEALEVNIEFNPVGQAFVSVTFTPYLSR